MRRRKMSFLDADETDLEAVQGEPEDATPQQDEPHKPFHVSRETSGPAPVLGAKDGPDHVRKPILGPVPEDAVLHVAGKEVYRCRKEDFLAEVLRVFGTGADLKAGVAAGEAVTR